MDGERCANWRVGREGESSCELESSAENWEAGGDFCSPPRSPCSIPPLFSHHSPVPALSSHPTHCSFVSLPFTDSLSYVVNFNYTGRKILIDKIS